ncbi:permease-like cell division protein FtsX [Atopobacter sp. AH10]|uniref:permease-like cell division protein FtsX n=1 Tax=Atopobacter sp. AH10 TaxID=2315861 RepID=UPI0013143EA3|nr:permease-like cell division protein FtsX [Atopobacter sp. AH10]
MFVRNFLRHIRDAFKGLRRNSLLTVASITAVTLTLILFGLATSFLMNVNHVAMHLEEQVTVKAFIDPAANPDDEKKLQESVQKISHVKSVEYRTKEQELKDLTKSQGQEFNIFTEDSNPLSNALVIKTTDPQVTKKVAEEVAKLAYVVDVNYGGESVTQFLSYVKTGRLIGMGVLGALLIIAIFLISNTVRTAIYARQVEIDIMRLVGAKNSYIRAPFFLEGGLIGLLGSIIPLALFIIGYPILYRYGMDKMAGTSLKLIPPYPHIVWISLAMVIVGVVIGSFGSLFSISRYLKK